MPPLHPSLAALATTLVAALAATLAATLATDATHSYRTQTWGGTLTATSALCCGGDARFDSGLVTLAALALAAALSAALALSAATAAHS